MGFAGFLWAARHLSPCALRGGEQEPCGQCEYRISGYTYVNPLAFVVGTYWFRQGVVGCWERGRSTCMCVCMWDEEP